MKRHPESPTSRARRAGRAAFTLIEILVALSAGVFVSIAAFAMSRNATAFFQHEARIATAQLSLTLGLNRLSNDLSRASFLSSPNARVDPMVCRDPSWGTTPGLDTLAGVTVLAGTSAGQNAANGITPDQLIIGGSLDVSETFTVQCVLTGTSGLALQLQDPKFDGAMARVKASLAPGETLQSRLETMFVPGRYVQLLDPATGYKVFGVLGDAPSVAVVSDVATVQLASTPSIPQKPANVCGILAPPSCGNGLLMSVVSRVRYDIRNLQGTTGTYADLVTPPSAAIGTVSGDSGRTELVRVEIGADNADVASTLEVVSEYAVDMRVGLSAVTGPITNDNYNPTVQTFEIGNAAVYTIAGDPTVNTSRPQHVRAVQVRLATRTRAPDREADLPVGADGRRLRFLVPGAQGPRPGSPGYARLRTAYVNVSLLNQGGFSLW